MVLTCILFTDHHSTTHSTLSVPAPLLGAIKKYHIALARLRVLGAGKMYADSVMTRHTMVSAMMQSVQAARPQITITLKGEEKGADVSAKYFTTRDTIEGEASFVVPSDTRFDGIYIGFEGKFEFEWDSP